MAECAVARCVQERRTLRRDVQKWGKNILLVLGLESIAEGLMGQEKWKVFSEPIIDTEVISATDWAPDDICCLCNSKKHPPPDPAKGVCSVDGMMVCDANNDSDSYYLDPDGCFSDTLYCGGSSPQSSLSPSRDQPLDLSVGSKAHTYWALMAEREATEGSAMLLKVPQLPLQAGKLKRRLDTLSCKRSYTEEELQAALRDIRSGKLGTRRAAVIYGIPRSTLRNKVYKLAMEKDYPKRNATNKNIEKAQSSPKIVPLSSRNVDSTTISPASTTKECSGKANTLGNPSGKAATGSGRSASESLRRLLRNRMVERAEARLQAAAQTSISSGSLSCTASDSSAGSWLRGFDSESLLSQVLSNVHQLALSRNGCESTSHVNRSESSKVLPDVIRRLTEERFAEECRRQQRSEGASSCAASRDGSTSPPKPTSPCSVILKIPSYRPAKSTSNTVAAESEAPEVTRFSSSQDVDDSGGGTVNISLREIIAKSIAQRMAGKRVPETSSLAALLEASPCNGRISKNVELDISHGEGSTSKRSRRFLETAIDSTPESTVPEGEAVFETKSEQEILLNKRIRPKRGRYRNYNKDDLVEAVRAVQRGEMSVHRAGSIFGVPHSTLEYKVKERHLLRLRSGSGKSRGGSRKRVSTRRDVNNDFEVDVPGRIAEACPVASPEGGGSSRSSSSCSSNCSAASSATSSCASNCSLTTAKETEENRKNSQGENPVASVTASRRGESSLWPSSTIFGVDFGQLSPDNFFASHMMKKLQEDALLQRRAAGEQRSEGKETLLLGVLLRSGLKVEPKGNSAAITENHSART